MRDIKVGYFGRTITGWPIYTADKEGFAAQEGIHIVQQSINQGNILAQGVLTGDFEIVQNSFETSMSLIMGGAPAKIVGVTSKAPPFQIITLPEIKTFADVKGKTAMVGDNNGSVRILLDRVLQQNGVAATDYRVVPGGGNPERFAALASRQVQVTILSSPQDIAAVKQGYTSIAQVSKYVKDMAYNGYVARTDWSEQNSDRLVAYLRALSRAQRWLAAPANKPAALQHLMDFLQIDATDAGQLYDSSFVSGDIFSLDGRLDPGGLDGMLDFYVKNGDLKPGATIETFWEGRYVEAANRGL